MKVTTQIYVLGRLGRWVATAGAAVAMLGLVAVWQGLLAELAFGFMKSGAVLIAFGAAFHFVAGDEGEIPKAVWKVLEDVDNERL